jgi:tetratricopeptide (TPR) repeat protein
LNLHEISKPQKKFSTTFHCLACDHQFNRQLPRIFVHWPTFQERVIERKPTPRSEYIIPQRIVCSKCGAIDKYELTQGTRNMLSMTLLVSSIINLPADHPVRIISFSIKGNVIMHPLDALDYYMMEVAGDPTNINLRLGYANVLRTLGYLDQAENQYQSIVDDDPSQIEAWLNLAAIHISRKHKRPAKKALRNLIDNASRSQHPDRDEWVIYAKDILDERLPLTVLTPDALQTYIDIETNGTSTNKLMGKKNYRRRKKKK